MNPVRVIRLLLIYLQNPVHELTEAILLNLANHLDLPAILWLQEYLTNETEGQTIVIVSHDRAFLNNVTEETIIFKDKQLKYHAGNYEDWERNTEEQRIRKQNMLEVCDILQCTHMTCTAFDQPWIIDVAC